MRWREVVDHHWNALIDHCLRPHHLDGERGRERESKSKSKCVNKHIVHTVIT